MRNQAQNRTEDMIIELRHELHECAEISGREYQTKQTLIHFIQTNTSLEIQDFDGGFLAIHRELSAKRTVVLRADYDALPDPLNAEKAIHLCGHDGHCAALCAVALWLEQRTIEKNVLLLFQASEETGEGANKCLPILQTKHIDEIYGAHNLPGYPLGDVFTKYGTFACGSEGLSIRMTGKPTHAAYPENGISPAYPMAEFMDFLKKEKADGTLCTVVGINGGDGTFGQALSEVTIRLTIRAEIQKDLDRLRNEIIQKAKDIAMRSELSVFVEETDVFPTTENHYNQADKVFHACRATKLQKPLRWSEDFGVYLKSLKGAFFGIGAGEECPALHTKDYEYPDELLVKTARAFEKILTYEEET